MKKYLYVLVALLLFGCDKSSPEGNSDNIYGIVVNGLGYEVTEKNIPNWQGLGVYCLLTNSNVQQLIMRDAGGVVKSGLAELYSSGNLIGKFLYDEAQQLYTLNYLPEEGKEYSIKISYNGTVVEASTSMPIAVERSFICNPLLVPQVYRESPFIDSKDEIDRERLYSLFEKYPSYTYKSEGNRVTYSYFTDNNGMVDMVVSTHSESDLFNKTEMALTMGYLILTPPEKYSGRSERLIADEFVWRDIEYSYCNKLLRIPLDKNSNPYHLASYVGVLDSSPVLHEMEIDYVLDLIKNNPQYGCYEDKCEFWGPNFLVLPYYANGIKDVAQKDCRQIILSASNEADLYLINCRDYSFDKLEDVSSNFTNITGGYGIFGAVSKAEYNFSSYREELTNNYLDIIDNLDVKPPLKYANPELDYRW